jgi:hypothetical protein
MLVASIVFFNFCEVRTQIDADCMYVLFYAEVVSFEFP